MILELQDLHTENGCVRTGAFTTSSECVCYRITGTAQSAVTCTVFFTDESGVRGDADVRTAQPGCFTLSGSFDAASLAVYRGAVSFALELTGALTADSLSVWEENTAAGTESAAAIGGKREKFVPQNVLFVGNSILLGMFNTYGMCATSPENDYCHHVQTAIRALHPDCRFAKLHGSGFEHADTMDAFEAWWSTAENVYTKKPARESFHADLDLIVIQLTDNVNTEAKVVVFDQTADILLRRIRQRCPRARILWVHGWYNRKNTVDRIRALSERHGFERIDIGDLRCRENESYSGQISQNAEGEPICVKDTWITHPGDAGMRAIADRILYALGM